MSKKIVLVFGATGTTGVYTVDYFTQHLDSKEYEVVASGRRNTDYYTKRGIKYCRCNMEDPNDFGELPTENVYAIVHLAAVLPSHMEGYHPGQSIDANVKGTLNILEYARRVKADRILYMKSIADYYGYLKDEIDTAMKAIEHVSLEPELTGEFCPQCGAIYHVRNHPSKKEGICDECGSELQQRKDDTVEQLKVRMDEYEAKTAPIIEYFEPKGVVTRIDASKDADFTFAQVKEALGKVA